MNDDQRRQNEIDQLEQWLARHLPPENVANIEHLKLRVRIELGENWLGTHLDPAGDQVDAGLVNEVLNALPQSERHRKRNARFVWACVGIGMAAVLAVSIWNSSVSPVSNGDLAMVESNDELWLDSIEESVDEDLEEIEDEISELSDFLALNNDTQWFDDTDF